MDDNKLLSYEPLVAVDRGTIVPTYPGRPISTVALNSAVDSEGSLTLGSVLAAFQRWLWVALPLSVLLSAIAAGLVWYFSIPTYRAVAWLGIEGDSPYIAFPKEREYKANPFIQTQIELIRSPLVLEAVVMDPSVHDLPVIAQSSAPAAWLSKKLAVEPVGLSELLQISIITNSPKASATIVNGVVNAYVEYQSHQGRARNSRIIALLEDERERRRTELQDLQEEFYRLAKASGRSVTVSGETQELGVAKNSVDSLEEKLGDAEVECEVLRARMKAMEENVRQTQHATPANAVEQALDVNPHVVELNTLLAHKRAMLAQAQLVSAAGGSDAVVTRGQQELQQLERQLAELRKQLRPQVATAVKSSLSDQRVDDLAEMKAQIRGYEVLEKNLQEQIEAQRAKLGVGGDDAWRLQLKRADVARAEEVLERISSRAEALRTEVQAPSQVTVLRRAAEPKLPDSASPNVKIAAAGFGAFALPFLCVLLLERRARRITESTHIVQDVNVPVVGEITHSRLGPLDSQRRLFGPSSRTRNAFQESIEYVRTRLLSRDEVSHLQVIAVASAVSGEGKTRLSAHLATSVARAQNARTLLIDADVRNPDLHGLFRVTPEPGLANVLSSECEWLKAVVPTAVAGLDILPAGKTQASPHALFANGRLEALLRELREVYQYIIIDCPPVLLVGDTLIIAKSADGAVLCTMHNHSCGPEVRSAYERLEGSGARVLGAVLSGVAPRSYVYPHRN